MYDYAFVKECGWPAECLVDDLVRDDQVAGVYFFAETADSTAGDYVSDAQHFEGINVGPVRYIGRIVYVSCAVSGEESDLHLAPPCDEDIAAGLAEWGVGQVSRRSGRLFEQCLSEATASDYADFDVCHVVRVLVLNRETSQ